MAQLKYEIGEDWQKLIDVKTGKVIQEGHRIDCAGLLIALGYDVEVIEEKEVYENDED